MNEAMDNAASGLKASSLSSLYPSYLSSNKIVSAFIKDLKSKSVPLQVSCSTKGVPLGWHF